MIILDCELTPKVQVSTSKGLYNIIKNHTDVTVDFPGLTNFTVTVFAIDSRYICKHLDFSWSLGDGSNASGKHVEHYYNKTGVYGVVLKIYEIYEHDSGKKLMGNVEMNIHVVKGLLHLCSFIINSEFQRLQSMLESGGGGGGGAMSNYFIARAEIVAH